jgi:hypothetical protein
MRSKVKSIEDSTANASSAKKVSRQSKGKTSGTRAGILRDWREASGKTAKDSGLHRDTMRDGR